MPVLEAQTIAAVIVAYESYYAYRSLVMRDRRKKTVKQILSQQRMRGFKD